MNKERALENSRLANESPIRFMQEDTHLFLTEALTDHGKPWIKLQEKNTKHFLVSRDYFFSPLSYADLAKEYGVTRQGIAGILRQSLRRLWRSSSGELKHKYPLDQLTKTKPKDSPGMVKHRVEKEYQGFKEIWELAKKGLSRSEIIKETGFRDEAIIRAVKTARTVGLEIPASLTSYENSKYIAQVLKTSSDPVLVQRCLNRATRSILSMSRKEEEPYLVFLSTIGRKKGYTKLETRKVYGILEKKGVPVGKIVHCFEMKGKKVRHRYYFTTKNFAEKAIQVLDEASL